MISTFTCTAWPLFSTEESMATPCSVKARGILRLPPQFADGELEVTICDLKFAVSCSVSENMKSVGNRAGFRLTA